MTRPIKIIHNAETGEITERPYNEEEMEQYLADQEARSRSIAELEDKRLKRANLLERLGISEEEALLIGRTF